MANHGTKTFQLPIGIEREDRCMGAGLQASKLSKALYLRLIWGLPGCLRAQFSAEHWGVVMEDEVAIHETKTFQLPMGIEREDRCMGAGL